MNLLLNILGLILLLIGGVVALVIKEPLPATVVVTEGDDINKAIKQTYKTKKWKWTKKKCKESKKKLLLFYLLWEHYYKLSLFYLLHGVMQLSTCPQMLSLKKQDLTMHP